MITIKRIVCPIDFSDFSKRALDQAAAVARLYGSTITVLHVFSVAPGLVPFAAPDVVQPFTLTPSDRERLLDSMKTFVHDEIGRRVPVELLLAEGNPVHTEILRHAEALNADLIVIGTHGRSGFEHLVLGSVTEKLLRKARAPILTVPRRVPDVMPTGPALYRSILCAIDFSECSLAALQVATSIATESKASLTVVNVIELPPEISEPTGPGPFAFEDIQRELEADSAAAFQREISQEMRSACAIDTVTAVGKPYQEILRIARERGSDLLVVGVHGRSAVDRMLFGSTAHHLVRQAVCPVLTLCSPPVSSITIEEVHHGETEGVNG